MTDKPTVPAEIWFNQVEGFSPEIKPSPVSPHMTFTCADATSTEGDTTALFAGFNLGWPYIELYGGQLPAPINILAVNMLTGETYMSPAAFSTASVQRPVRLYLSEAEVNSGPPAFNQSFVNAWFNADLPSLLELPPDEGLYGVSLWIDDLMTPVQAVQVSGNSSRPTAPLIPTEVTTPGLVTIQKSSYSPSAEDGLIRLDGPLPEGGNQMYGTLPNNVFSSPPMPMDGANPVLTLFGFCQRTRFFFWYRDTEFYAKAKADNVFSFNFDPFRLIEPPEVPENLFISVQLGTLRAEPSWIPAETTIQS